MYNLYLIGGIFFVVDRTTVPRKVTAGCWRELSPPHDPCCVLAACLLLVSICFHKLLDVQVCSEFLFYITRNNSAKNVLYDLSYLAIWNIKILLHVYDVIYSNLLDKCSERLPGYMNTNSPVCSNWKQWFLKEFIVYVQSENYGRSPIHLSKAYLRVWPWGFWRWQLCTL